MYEACNLFLTLDVTLFSPSGRSSGFRIPSGTLAFYLLADASAYGPAYRKGFHCLQSCFRGLLTV